MFKKLRNHDKGKSKSNGVSGNGSANGSANGGKAKNMARAPEKESTQHIENAGPEDNEEENDRKMRALLHIDDEDPADLEPISEDPNLPFGDGANKIFGMENFGNTCYCNSILQVLYYTTEFRRAMLMFPERDPDHFRKRRLNVPGTKLHGFVQAHLNQQRDEQHQQQGDSTANTAADIHDENGTKEKKRFLGMGGKSSKTSASNGAVSANGGFASHANGSSGIGSITNGSSENGADANGASTGDGVSNLQNTHLIDKNIVNKYPALKTIKPVYQLNQQRTLSILGDTEDPNANVERRKRYALMNGPIINLDHAYNDTYGMQKNLFSSLKDIFECMVENKSQTGVVSPQKLIEVLKEENELFRSSMHQDAHEFLNFLVNSVLEVVDDYDFSHSAAALGTSGTDSEAHQPRKISNTSSLDEEKKAVHDIFEGLLTSETKCLCCETVSSRDEKFLDLSIDLTPTSSVTSCLKQFSASEMLQEQNKFYCDSCHSLQEAAKTIKLKKLPKILALHLKRFKYSEELNRNMKLFHRVTYPKNLRLFNTTTDTETPDKLYQLYAVVVHIGGGPHHGHYVSLIKTENFGWLLFDDEAVESVDENYVYKFFGDGPGLATAYVLFYKETDELSNMKNNLFSGFEDDETLVNPEEHDHHGHHGHDHDSNTLDLKFNQNTGHLDHRQLAGESATMTSESFLPDTSTAATSIINNSDQLQTSSGATPATANTSTAAQNGAERKKKVFGWKR